MTKNLYTLKNAGLFQPKFGSNMDKPQCWVKNAIKKMFQKRFKFEITFLSQHLGLSIFYSYVMFT